jgi:flagellar basal-body rod protein FlgB
MLGDLPVFTVLKARMEYHQARQKVLAENVANADTPGYKAKDLKEFEAKLDTVSAAGALTPMVTNASHLTGRPIEGGFGPKAAGAVKSFETRPSRNAVNLEDEMMKVARNQADYQAATTLYSKSLAFLKIAIGKRG